MIAEEFILIPKKTYFKELPLTEQILNNPRIEQKALQLSTLQRMEPAVETVENLQSLEPKNTVSIKDVVFSQLRTLTDAQLRKADYIYDTIHANGRVDVDSVGNLTIDGTRLYLPASTFLYNLQQNTKVIDKQLYTDILQHLSIPEQFIANKHAKEIIKDTEASSKYRAESRVTSPTKSWTPFKK